MTNLTGNPMASAPATTMSKPYRPAPRLGCKSAVLLLLALAYIWRLFALIQIQNASSFANVSDASTFAPRAGELLDKNTHPVDKANNTSVAITGNIGLEENCSTAANTAKTLAFVHIPKTGGSAIEEAARDQASIQWGSYGWKGIEINNWTYLWHIPPSLLPALFEGHEKPPAFPYEGHKLFTVIRNPFSRAVSNWLSKIRMGCLSSSKQCSKVKETANIRIRKQLTEQLECNNTATSKCYVWRGKTDWIPQWHYIYDRHSGERRVHYLLHFERLSQDFEALMRAHSLDISLGSARQLQVTAYPNATREESENFAGIAELEESTVRLIIELYRLDFKIGGYSLDPADAISHASPGNTFRELPCRLDEATV